MGRGDSQFRRLGRAWHPCVDDGYALVGVLDLDEALWIATAAPVATFRADPVFLARVAGDVDGRIRADGVRTAIRWLLAKLSDPGEIREGVTSIRLSAFSAEADELRATARMVLTRTRGADGEDPSVSLAAVRIVLAEELAERKVATERIAGLQELEQLLLYKAGMLPLVNSFVSCRDLFEPGRHALFEWGTLVLDGRRFELAVRVTEPARHEFFTRRGALCVMYVEIGDGHGVAEYEVAVPITAGTRGFLVQGTWGVFLEHSGRERHARVRTIVLHPISLIDAVFSPFRRLAEAFQGAVDTAGAGLETADAPAHGVPSGPLPPPPPPPLLPPKPAAAAGVLAIMAGAGIVLAAVTSALAYVSDRFVAAASTIGAWIVGLPVVAALPAESAETVRLVAYPAAVVVVIMGMLALPVIAYLIPVSLAAWLKLRRRDLGTLLIGSGWAVNARLRVTRDVAHRLTRRPVAARSRRRD